jgi:Tudor domain
VRKDANNPWVRGVVTGIVENPKSRDSLFKVMAVDYGAEFVVSASHILRYPNIVKNAYTNLPALAITCCLAGLKERMDVKTMDERRKEMSFLLRRGER